jgi:hypothetical protein
MVQKLKKFGKERLRIISSSHKEKFVDQLTFAAKNLHGHERKFQTKRDDLS